MIENIIFALNSLPVYTADRDDPRKRDQIVMLAEAVDYASRIRDWQGSRKELAALLVTIGYHESGFALHVHGGQCKPWECDRGRARGPWQVHRNRLNEDAWDGLVGLDPASTRLAAVVAAQALARARAQCAARTPNWLTLTLSAYAGRGCSSRWPGVAPRVSTYGMVLRQIETRFTPRKAQDLPPRARPPRGV